MQNKHNDFDRTNNATKMAATPILVDNSRRVEFLAEKSTAIFPPTSGLVAFKTFRILTEAWNMIFIKGDKASQVLLHA
jgi:hypothetical protein